MSAPQHPEQPPPPRRRSSISVKFVPPPHVSRERSFLMRCFGIRHPIGDVTAVVNNWNSLALICAMLTSIASAGFFSSADYVNKYSASASKNSAINGTITVIKNDELTSTGLHVLAKWTTMLFCVDTFCFLNTTVMA